MPKLKNSNATFWVIFKHCEGRVLVEDGHLSQEQSYNTLSGQIGFNMVLIESQTKRSTLLSRSRYCFDLVFFLQHCCCCTTAGCSYYQQSSGSRVNLQYFVALGHSSSFVFSPPVFGSVLVLLAKPSAPTCTFWVHYIQILGSNVFSQPDSIRRCLITRVET